MHHSANVKMGIQSVLLSMLSKYILVFIFEGYQFQMKSVFIISPFQCQSTVIFVKYYEKLDHYWMPNTIFELKDNAI